MSWLRILLPAVLILMGLIHPAYGAKDLDHSRRDLQHVRQQIKSTQQQLSKKQRAARQLVKKLRSGERQLRESRNQLRSAQQKLATLKTKISEQQTRLHMAQKKQQDLEGQVKDRLRVLYKGGNSQLAKVLFSAQSPAAVAEDYHFLQRMVRRDRALLADYREQLRATEDELKHLAALQVEQKKATTNLTSSEKSLRTAQQKRQRLLGRVRKDEDALAVLLQELEEKAARLSGLIDRLEKAPAKPSAVHGTHFGRQKGRLPWPVKGPVKVGFGTGRHPVLGTRYDSHGIEIGVNGEKPVRAVWNGYVIFAKAFRGYGNLLIIDHGDGYYTLYAQASRLLHKAGDRVEGGEKVAISGFEGSDVVYFEIRKGGNPLDPLRWLDRRRR